MFDSPHLNGVLFHTPSPSLLPSTPLHSCFSINFADHHADNKTEETYEFEFFDPKTTRSADKISFQKASHRREEQNSERTRKPKSPSLVMALARSFGGTFFVAGLFKLCQDLLNFVSPQLLKYAILLASNKRDSVLPPSLSVVYSLYQAIPCNLQYSET